MEINTKEDLKKILEDLKAENTLLSERLDSLKPEPEPEPEETPEDTPEESDVSDEEVDEISKLLLD